MWQMMPVPYPYLTQPILVVTYSFVDLLEGADKVFFTSSTCILLSECFIGPKENTGQAGNVRS